MIDNSLSQSLPGKIYLLLEQLCCPRYYIILLIIYLVETVLVRGDDCLSVRKKKIDFLLKAEDSLFVLQIPSITIFISYSSSKMLTNPTCSLYAKTLSDIIMIYPYIFFFSDLASTNIKGFMSHPASS